MGDRNWKIENGAQLTEFEINFIGISSKVKGLIFEETFHNAKNILLSEVSVRIIDIRDLITAKKSANRPKDQDDLEHLPN